MKKHVKFFTAILTVLAMAGCSQSGFINDYASPTDSGSEPVSTSPASGGSSKPASTSPEAGGSSEPANSSSSKFEGTDIGGKKDSFFDKISEAFDGEYGMADTAGVLDFADEAPAAAAEGEPGGALNDGCIIIDPDFPVDPEFPIEPAIPPQSGLLTGGEWNDNSHWADWNALYGSRDDWKRYKEDWRISDDYRLTVTVTSDGKPLEGATVKWGDKISSVTDNKGRAYLFSDELLFEVTTVCGDMSTTAQVDWVLDEHDLSFSVALDGAVSPVAQKLDLMIMCDTTGSMGDELEYLKVELEDIVKSIKSNNANIPTRVSVNFYRDTEDEYEVRQFPFSDNIDEVAEAIRAQSASGGGDFPEAVHTALDSAVNGHDWNDDSVKILFLVLDAPPHDDAQIIDSVNKYVAAAAAMGIRIIPIASSGIDKSTEYLLRTMAFTTGGTYTFLTDDSGVGYGHIEPTVGAYNVERLNDMMVRIVNGYLAK
ncbi:MAG: VWA domain-containing protein [Oscillospiraceae bacterium]|nr:VWA domain-containing protein [Oscillospiraceae bacterium]